jgi:hypothetical protein
MTKHMTSTRKDWLAARLELLEAEKDLTRPRASSKCSKTVITSTTIGSRITRRRSTLKPACSFPNGENYSLLRKDKVGKAPRSACMRRIEA